MQGKGRGRGFSCPMRPWSSWQRRTCGQCWLCRGGGLPGRGQEITSLSECFEGACHIPYFHAGSCWCDSCLVPRCSLLIFVSEVSHMLYHATWASSGGCGLVLRFPSVLRNLIFGSKIESFLILGFERCSNRIQISLQKRSSMMILEYLDIDVKIDFFYSIILAYAKKFLMVFCSTKWKCLEAVFYYSFFLQKIGFCFKTIVYYHDGKDFLIACLTFPPPRANGHCESCLQRCFKCLDPVKALQTVYGRYLFLGIDPWILLLWISSDIKH